MIPVDKLTEVVGNQTFGLTLDAQARDWLRRSHFSGLLEPFERPQADALTSQLRQVQQYAALLPPGLRCQCRSNGRSMPLAGQHCPCCPMFARLPQPADPREEGTDDPWDLSIDDVAPPTH